LASPSKQEGRTKKKPRGSKDNRRLRFIISLQLTTEDCQENVQGYRGEHAVSDPDRLHPTDLAWAVLAAPDAVFN
jgi:hypothetical protein